MSRTYNDYYFEKEDVMDELHEVTYKPEKNEVKFRLSEIGLLTRLLRIVYEEQGLDMIKCLVRSKTNRKFIWFNDEMMTDIINDIEEGIKDE